MLSFAVFIGVFVGLVAALSNRIKAKRANRALQEREQERRAERARRALEAETWLKEFKKRT
jgi:hypothetical protein